MTGQGGGFNLFGGKARRLLRTFMDELTAFSRQALTAAVTASVMHFYAVLRGRLQDRLRELTFCKQRLRHMQESLENPQAAADEFAAASRFDGERSPLPSAESYWETIRETETAKLVLPDGETELERAAGRFLESLKTEQWAQLELSLQEQVLTPLGGVHRICVTYNDLARSLATPVLNHLSTVLSEFLPITDVAQVDASAAEARGVALAKQIEKYHHRAAPSLGSTNPAQQQSYLLVPASETGKVYGEQASQALPQLVVMRAPGQADLMFCREQGYLNPEDLRPLLNACRSAYDETTLTPTSSPHARFDVTDWIPVDP
jgi:hypothetical protein